MQRTWLASVCPAFAGLSPSETESLTRLPWQRMTLAEAVEAECSFITELPVAGQPYDLQGILPLVRQRSLSYPPAVRRKHVLAVRAESLAGWLLSRPAAAMAYVAWMKNRGEVIFREPARVTWLHGADLTNAACELARLLPDSLIIEANNQGKSVFDGSGIAIPDALVIEGSSSESVSHNGINCLNMHYLSPWLADAADWENLLGSLAFRSHILIHGLDVPESVSLPLAISADSHRLQVTRARRFYGTTPALAVIAEKSYPLLVLSGEPDDESVALLRQFVGSAEYDLRLVLWGPDLLIWMTVLTSGMSVSAAIRVLRKALLPSGLTDWTLEPGAVRRALQSIFSGMRLEDTGIIIVCDYDGSGRVFQEGDLTECLIHSAFPAGSFPGQRYVSTPSLSVVQMNLWRTFRAPLFFMRTGSRSVRIPYLGTSAGAPFWGTHAILIDSPEAVSDAREIANANVK